MIKIMIAAPTPALRAGLRALLAADELTIVGETPTLDSGAASLADADLLLVAGEALSAEPLRRLPHDGHLALVVLSDDESAAALLRDLPLRGWGIVGRDASPEELQAAVRAVAHGFVLLPTRRASQLLIPRASVSALAEPPAEPLTNREREVLDLISQGLPNKLIARQLQISEHTVKFHISSIFAKLGASSRTEAISRGARQGLITM